MIESNDSNTQGRRRMSPVIKLVLGAATVLTLGFAGVSAWAVHSEPTEPAATEIETTSIADSVRRSWQASQRRPVDEAGATAQSDYMRRASGLARDL